eukprot:GDKJ01021921.1.p1 GENE.GDKJ01021921.1~~GDKJ01021921.1.p1  ORF type:complete len:703 (+),score=163.85 GDKJ01021921.1:2-2110(+)
MQSLYLYISSMIRSSRVFSCLLPYFRSFSTSSANSSLQLLERVPSYASSKLSMCLLSHDSSNQNYPTIQFITAPKMQIAEKMGISFRDIKLVELAKADNRPTIWVRDGAVLMRLGHGLSSIVRHDKVAILLTPGDCQKGSRMMSDLSDAFHFQTTLNQRHKLGKRIVASVQSGTSSSSNTSSSSSASFPSQSDLVDSSIPLKTLNAIWRSMLQTYSTGIKASHHSPTSCSDDAAMKNTKDSRTTSPVNLPNKVSVSDQRDHQLIPVASPPANCLTLHVSDANRQLSPSQQPPQQSSASSANFVNLADAEFYVPSLYALPPLLNEADSFVLSDRRKKTKEHTSSFPTQSTKKKDKNHSPTFERMVFDRLLHFAVQGFHQTLDEIQESVRYLSVSLRDPSQMKKFEVWDESLRTKSNIEELLFTLEGFVEALEFLLEEEVDFLNLHLTEKFILENGLSEDSCRSLQQYDSSPADYLAEDEEEEEESLVKEASSLHYPKMNLSPSDKHGRHAKSSAAQSGASAENGQGKTPLEKLVLAHKINTSHMEMLLEIHKQIAEDLKDDLKVIKKKLENSELAAQMRLDTNRNNIMEMELRIAASTSVLALVTLVAGFLGMNLKNGGEESPDAFANVVASSVVVGIILNFVILRRFRRMNLINSLMPEKVWGERFTQSTMFKRGGANSFSQEGGLKDKDFCSQSSFFFGKK